MKTEQRTVYITNDGSEFFNEGEALAHEAKCNIAVALENSNLYFSSTSAEEVADWIVANHASLLDEFVKE